MLALGRRGVDLGAVVVYSHASDPGGVAELELYVDGELARVDAATDGNQNLTAFEQVWTPPGNGSYILQVRAKNGNGSFGFFSILVHLILGEIAQVPGQPPPVSGVRGPQFQILLSLALHKFPKLV